jgi:hypothetical protein
MTHDSARDSRATGYMMVFAGVLNAGMAVDRTFFHPAAGLRWLTATTALLLLVGGAWILIKRRAPHDWMDDWARNRWGSRGPWLVNAVFAAVVVASIWLLSRAN